MKTQRPVSQPLPVASKVAKTKLCKASTDDKAVQHALISCQYDMGCNP